MSVVCDPIQINLSETNLRTTTMFDTFAKILIAVGVFLILVGVIVLVLGKMGILKRASRRHTYREEEFRIPFPRGYLYHYQHHPFTSALGSFPLV